MPGGVDGSKMSRFTSRQFLPLIFIVAFLGGCGAEDGIDMNPMDPAMEEPDPPSVAVVFPNGGERLAGRVRIEWTAEDPDPGETEMLEMMVEFSADNGISWTEIFTPRGNPGSLDWDLALMAESDEYLVRVTAWDTSGLSTSDASDSIFSVVGGIFIEDITGHQWDITHAVEVFGMEVDYWGHGLGPDAIKPINDPQFLSPGDPGYPPPTLMTQIIGFERGGDARAYPLSTMSGYEVVNDWYGDEALAVIY